MRPELEMERGLLDASDAFLEGSRWRPGINFGRFPVPFFGMYYWRPSVAVEPPLLAQRADFPERVGYLSEEGASRHNSAWIRTLGQMNCVGLSEYTSADVKRGRLVVQDDAESIYGLAVRIENKDRPGTYLTYESFAYSSITGMLGYVKNARIEDSMRTGSEVYDQKIIPVEGIELPEVYGRAIEYLAPQQHQNI